MMWAKPLSKQILANNLRDLIEASWPKYAIFCRLHFQMHFLEEAFRIFIQMSLKFIPKGPIDNKYILVQLLSWH